MPGIEIPKERLINIFGSGSMQIKYKDIFNLGELYDAMKYWVQENEWTDLWEEKTDENWETLYSEKIGRNGGREIFIRWRLKRKPEDTEQLMYYLDIDFHTINLESTEVIKDGKKIKTNNGEIKIDIGAYVDTKYVEELEKHAIFKYLKKIFMRRIYDPTPRVKELYREVYGLQNYIKQWFKLKRYLPYEEIKGFHPPHGQPSHLK